MAPWPRTPNIAMKASRDSSCGIQIAGLAMISTVGRSELSTTQAPGRQMINIASKRPRPWATPSRRRMLREASLRVISPLRGDLRPRGRELAVEIDGEKYREEDRGVGHGVGRAHASVFVRGSRDQRPQKLGAARRAAIGHDFHDVIGARDV